MKWNISTSFYTSSQTFPPPPCSSQKLVFLIPLYLLVLFFFFFFLASSLSLGICSPGYRYTLWAGTLRTFSIKLSLRQLYICNEQHGSKLKGSGGKFKDWYWQILDNVSSWLQLVRKPVLSGLQVAEASLFLLQHELELAAERFKVRPDSPSFLPTSARQ